MIEHKDTPGAWGVMAESKVWTYTAPSGESYAIAKGTTEGLFRVSHIRENTADGRMTLVLIGQERTLESACESANTHSWVWVSHWQELPQDDPDKR